MTGENFSSQMISIKSLDPYIVMPDIDDLEDHKEFLVMYVIVEFDNLEYVRMKYNWIDFFFFYYN